MNTILSILFTLLCLSIPFGILVVAAVLGTRSKLRYAKRIQDAQARGAFADMNAPEYKSRFRLLALFALIGVLGMTLSIAILFVQLITKFTNLYGITLAVALVFGIIGAGAGLLMQREINRRL
jgi:hypothetical protein